MKEIAQPMNSQEQRKFSNARNKNNPYLFLKKTVGEFSRLTCISLISVFLVIAPEYSLATEDTKTSLGGSQDLANDGVRYINKVGNVKAIQLILAKEDEPVNIAPRRRSNSICMTTNPTRIVGMARILRDTNIRREVGKISSIHETQTVNFMLADGTYLSFLFEKSDTQNKTLRGAVNPSSPNETLISADREIYEKIYEWAEESKKDKECHYVASGKSWE